MGDKTLPATTHPAKERIQRQHQPETKTRKGGYQDYRECLRWEFGFSCAFCLLHEADLEKLPAHAGRSGHFWIEHATPQSLDDALANVYVNCFYSCRFCNGSRGDKPVQNAEGRTLLNPVSDVWADHFDVVGDSLVPKTDDARFTEHEMYRINDKVKIDYRRLRREAITEALARVAQAPREIEANLKLAQPCVFA